MHREILWMFIPLYLTCLGPKANGLKEIESFLTTYERTRPIQTEGNCFLRAISEAIYDEHE